MPAFLPQRQVRGGASTRVCNPVCKLSRHTGFLELSTRSNLGKSRSATFNEEAGLRKGHMLRSGHTDSSPQTTSVHLQELDNAKVVPPDAPSPRSQVQTSRAPPLRRQKVLHTHLLASKPTDSSQHVLCARGHRSSLPTWGPTASH